MNHFDKISEKLTLEELKMRVESPESFQEEAAK